MLVLELFAGTGSISNAFRERGHKTITVDRDISCKPDILVDIQYLTPESIHRICNGKPNVIWCSFDCTTYSVARVYQHRRLNKETGNLDPVSDYAKECDHTNKLVLQMIDQLNPELWFIENPRGCLRKMDFMKDLPRYTVTYCQYGDDRMKPTDIWTNHPAPRFKPMCKNGDPCHTAAPEVARQGCRDKRTRKSEGRYRKHFVNIL